MKGRKSTLIESKSEVMKILTEYIVDCVCFIFCGAICYFGLVYLLEYEILPYENVLNGVVDVTTTLMMLAACLSSLSGVLLANIGIGEGDRICIWYRWKVVRFSLMLHWRNYSCLDESIKRYEEAREEEDSIV